MDAHYQNTQQQENSTKADHKENSYSLEKWEDRNVSITTDLCDINDAVQSVNLIT